MQLESEIVREEIPEIWNLTKEKIKESLEINPETKEEN